jgi:prepilin-type N-terminal cleavage/methylation domain-containing protein
MSEQKFDNGFFGSSRAENGFSIIEMLIAIAVIVFGLVSIAGISAYISRTNSTSATLNVLAAAAQDQVDRLRTARWTRTFSDPMLSIGGSVPYVASSSLPEPSPAKPMFSPTVSLAQTGAAGFFSSPITSALPTPTPTGGTYTYVLDPENPHHATAVGTAAGDLSINWQVRQGATADLRYVTIQVIQVGAPPQLADGITVTTIIVRN